MIHRTWKSDYELLDDVVTDQKTIYHRTFYEKAKSNTSFYDVYESFIEQEIRPLFDEAIIYQKIPTFRAHLPNNLGVAAFHRDRNYGHSTNEVNVFLPITKAFDTNTIWVEAEEDKKDFLPMEAEYGNYYVWNGASLLHGNKVNDTKKTRISIDFRVMPYSRYEKNDNVTVTKGTKLTVGEYFKELEE